tara:strand:- start:28 stop:180 length:153 start_codon:yes stop_codon:yes gene_type:complete
MESKHEYELLNADDKDRPRVCFCIGADKCTDEGCSLVKEYKEKSGGQSNG